MTFTEWVAHWGEARLAKQRAQWVETYGGMWDRRHVCVYGYPCWELVPGVYWSEDWVAISALWQRCGGRLFEKTRLIAAKWDDVWARFALRFPNGNLKQYPPYGPESCAVWSPIGADEAIVLGVITQKELDLNTPRSPEGVAEMKQILEEMPAAQREELFRELDEYDAPATREARYKETQRRQAEARRESERAYAEQGREREAINAAFTRMSAMDATFHEAAQTRHERSENLMCELQQLMRNNAFDRYPHWRARAIRYAGMLLEEEGRVAEALEYYVTALGWDERQPLKRRIAALRKKLGR